LPVVVVMLLTKYPALVEATMSKFRYALILVRSVEDS
jgi:hypothetical protein